jgi:hypothetical protein
MVMEASGRESELYPGYGTDLVVEANQHVDDEISRGAAEIAEFSVPGG